MNDWAELGRALDALVSGGNAEVREDGEWLAELATLHCEMRGLDKNPLVHLWSGERNLTRRIVRVREQSKERIVLEVHRFGRTKPSRLEFLRTDSRRSTGRITREQFRARFGRLLGERFPDAVVESLTAAPDLEHSFSGVYVRGRMHEGGRAWAVLAVSPGEASAAVDGILTFGILWLDWLRQHAERHAIAGVRLFVPAGSSGRLRARAGALSSAGLAEIFEFCESEDRIERKDPADAGNLDSWLVPRREAESAVLEARDAAGRIECLAPKLTAAGGSVRVAPVPGEKEAGFSYRGLEFARWSSEGMRFGLGDAKKNLTALKEGALERLLGQMELHRHALSRETNHALYRAAPERWLESIVLEDPAKLDAHLDPRYLYSQVPAVAAGDRGVLDLLGVTRRGRLVVIELKASEDIQMPMQAVDYWLRVRRHQREGDFERSGYFAGVEIDPQPPLVWLVAPALRFHSALETVLPYLAPEIHVTRIGLNETWRRGLKVMFRK